MSYTWKEFDVHKRTVHTFEELDRALWEAVDAKIMWNIDRDCPA
jgi:hypothetical protein